MDRSQRLSAFIAYLLPVIGWIFLGFFQNKNQFARFHMRQSVGLFLFLILVTAGWGVVTWLLAWIPYAVVLGFALFSLPLAAYIFGVIAWVLGMVNALSGRIVYLPIFGSFANSLPL